MCMMTNVILGNCPRVDEKKYGKWFLYLESPQGFSWMVTLAEIRDVFCEH